MPYQDIFLPTPVPRVFRLIGRECQLLVDKQESYIRVHMSVCAPLLLILSLFDIFIYVLLAQDGSSKPVRNGPLAQDDESEVDYDLLDEVRSTKF